MNAPKPKQRPPTVLGHFKNLFLGLFELFASIGDELGRELSKPQRKRRQSKGSKKSR